jgi:rubrerythrin
MKKQSVIRKLIMISIGLLIISCSDNDVVRSAKYNLKAHATQVNSQANAERSRQIARAKTIANMLGAFELETKASARYARFSQKAKEEGYPQMAVLFKATSEAEKVHATNHLTVLVNMGINVHPVDTRVIIETTEENLKASMASEAYVVNKMYPLFINDAVSADNHSAIASLREAYISEEIHMRDYEKALAIFNSSTKNAYN